MSPPLKDKKTWEQKKNVYETTTQGQNDWVKERECL